MSIARLIAGLPQQNFDICTTGRYAVQQMSISVSVPTNTVTKDTANPIYTKGLYSVLAFRYKSLPCSHTIPQPHIISLLLLLFSYSLKAQTVYKTPSGAKYHLATCHMVKNVPEEITIAKTNELGLEPCKICNLPVSLAQTPQKKPQGQNATVQCSGLTKAGTRCQHKTAIANGYCYQHQP